jgi:antitoxin component HigA of HigAB toxin-antitoxin module
MATSSRPPIQNATEFQHALSEVERLLDTPPLPASLEDRWFNHLLGQIADYNEAQPRAVREAYADRILDLDRHLQMYGKHWPSRSSRPDDHWSPLLGGDLDPTHHRH